MRLVQDQVALGRLLSDLKGAARVGVDTEANSFHAYYERVCLIQLSTEAADWVVDPLVVDPRPIGPLFADEKREVIFHAGEFDVLSLKRDFGFSFQNLFDTQVAAMLLGMGQVGYATLVEELFGVVLKKGQQRSDWGRRPLTARQIAYAAADTRYLIPLRERLWSMLVERRRVDDAKAGFARLAASEPRPRVFDPEGYRRIKGFRELDPAGRAIVRALYTAREKRAQSLDRPPFRVIGNDVMIRLATERPTDEDSLTRTKGLPEAALRHFCEGIIGAIKAGMADPDPPPVARPRRARTGRRAESLGPEAEARFQRLRRWRNERAAERGMEGQLIARNDVLRAIAKEAPRDLKGLRKLAGGDAHLVESYGGEILKAIGEGEKGRGKGGPRGR